MSKGLELLNHLLTTYIDEQNYDYSAYIEIEKSLKALEIIKEYFEFNDFNELVPIKNIPNEKYVLLKEVLL